VELSKHDPYKHINDQLTRFINSMDNPRTKNAVIETLYDEIVFCKILGLTKDEMNDICSSAGELFRQRIQRSSEK